MRVQGIDNMATTALERQSAPTQVEASDGRIFSRRLSQLSEEAYTESVKKAIEDITRQGEVVAKKADISEFKKYRDMVRDLLGDTVSNAFEFSKSMRFDMRGRTKTFALIKRVNTKLDEMMQGLLEQEVDHISLLGQLDDIRGMLVDIFL